MVDGSSGINGRTALYEILGKFWTYYVRRHNKFIRIVIRMKIALSVYSGQWHIYSGEGRSTFFSGAFFSKQIYRLQNVFLIS